MAPALCVEVDQEAPVGHARRPTAGLTGVMKNAMNEAPSGAVAGLADILLALGDELRRANFKIGEYSVEGEDGEVAKEPILFLAGATVELAVTASVSALGGVKVWVVNAEGGADYERSGKITVQLNTGGEPLAVGM